VKNSKHHIRLYLRYNQLRAEEEEMAQRDNILLPGTPVTLRQLKIQIWAFLHFDLFLIRI
jgi:hypothetical protein